MINRFNADLNMSKLSSPGDDLPVCRLLIKTVDMTLPNHAVNVMFDGTGIIGSLILIIIAGPYVSIIAFKSTSYLPSPLLNIFTMSGPVLMK